MAGYEQALSAVSQEPPEVRAQEVPVAAGDQRELGRRIWSAVGGFLSWVLRLPWQVLHLSVGTVTLLVALAWASTVPVVQWVVLGYLLHVSAQATQRNRPWPWLPGAWTAGWWGWTLMALALTALPLWIGALILEEAHWVWPQGEPQAQLQQALQLGVWVYGAFWLIVAGLVCWIRPQTFAQVRDHVWQLCFGHLPRLWYLGFRGWLGAALWLVVPVSVMVWGAQVSLAQPSEEALSTGQLVSLLGMLLLAFVVVQVVVIQTRFAHARQMRVFWQWGQARRCFAQAPLAWWLGISLLLTLALPLYVFKLAVIPQDAAWLPGVLFIVMALPGRWVCGWALGRSLHRSQPRRWLWRWLARVGLVPVALVYALVVYLSQYAVWHGLWGLYEQHALLLPIPTIGH